jgi:hypothetical protein
MFKLKIQYTTIMVFKLRIWFATKCMGKACSQGPPLTLDLKISRHPWNVPFNVKHKRCFIWMCKGNLHANGGRSFQLTKPSYVQGCVFEKKTKKPWCVLHNLENTSG